MKKNHQLAIIAIAILMLTILCGCIKAPLPDTPNTGSGSTTSLPPITPLQEARNAMAQRNYARAELLAQKLTQGGTLASSEQAEALRIYAIAALNNNHPNASLQALAQWTTADSSISGSKEWQDLWYQGVKQLSPYEAKNRASTLAADTSIHSSARARAKVLVSTLEWQEHRLGDTLATLNAFYTSASQADKVQLEQTLALELLKLDQPALNLLSPVVTEENRRLYPYSIIFIDQLHRQAKIASSADYATETLRTLSKEITLADASLFKNPPSLTVIEAESFASQTTDGAMPTSGRPVVLALPISGQFGNIAAKIVAGAEIACSELSSRGTPVSLIVIDTDQSDWLSKIEGLPTDATVIGGPLRSNDYASLKSSGLTTRKSFFTFLPTLPAQDEGRVAWRFFASPTDQVKTLLKLTTSLGITDYAVFYPQDAYGQRMAELFTSIAKRNTGTTVTEGSYTPRAQAEWLNSVSELLAKSGKETDKPQFRAIFLPDTWKNMDPIIPNLFYKGETRLVLLGTAIWGQEISGRGQVSPEYFRLGVFPGAWSSNISNAASDHLRSTLTASGKGPADFWHSLGYDFARFAASTQITPDFSPTTVNNALQHVAMTWSMAPMTWNASGEASQSLYLFTPIAGGYALLDEIAFKKAYESAWK